MPTPMTMRHTKIAVTCSRERGVFMHAVDYHHLNAILDKGLFSDAAHRPSWICRIRATYGAAPQRVIPLPR